MRVEINGLNINYLKKGTGKKVLIIPGWNTTINTYKPLYESISSYACVYLLDMPGCGDSDEPKSSYNIDDYCNLIIEFIKSQNIKELSIIGHSNGGRIIIKLLSKIKLDFKIKKIVLIGCAGIKHKPRVLVRFKIRLYKLCKFFLYKNSLFNKFVGNMGSIDYVNSTNIMKETMIKLINEDMYPYLSNISTPTLIIWGENDIDTPLNDAYVMNNLISNSKLVVVKNTSHYVFLEKSLYVNALIKKFLGDLL